MNIYKPPFSFVHDLAICFVLSQHRYFHVVFDVKYVVENYFNKKFYGLHENVTMNATLLQVSEIQKYVSRIIYMRW